VRIGFASAASARMFSEFDLLTRAFGLEVAYKVANRLALLSAADSLALVPTSPPIECRPLDGADSRFSVSVSETLRLVFSPLSGGTGRAGLTKVTAIEIAGLQKQ
jgi:hypothetical protein